MAHIVYAVKDYASLVTLLDRGADVNADDGFGKTALMYAALNKCDKSVKLLLDRGADVNAVNNGGADVNGASNNGWTALMYAACYKCDKSMKLLLERGADANAASNIGRTALMYADGAYQIYEEIDDMELLVELLLERGADVNAVDNNGRTALMYAACYKCDKSMKLLLERGADANAASNIGRTALMYAVDADQIYEEIDNMELLVELLLDGGADVNAASNIGKTALMYAALNKCDLSVKLLLDGGADVNAVNNNGRTALMETVPTRYDYYNVVCQLVAAGDRSWDHVPSPCPGLEMALMSVYTNAPGDLPELFRRLEPGVKQMVQNALMVLHRGLVHEEDLKLNIVCHILQRFSDVYKKIPPYPPRSNVIQRLDFTLSDLIDFTSERL